MKRLVLWVLALQRWYTEVQGDVLTFFCRRRFWQMLWL